VGKRQRLVGAIIRLRKPELENLHEPFWYFDLKQAPTSQ
jgi:hypothetical protein